MAAKKSGNASTKVTTVGQATALKLSKATEGLSKIVSELQSTNDSYEELVTNIELKQAELDGLDAQFEERVREMEADLKIKRKESENAMALDILKSTGRVAIDATELASLKNELESLKANFDKNVKAETEKAVAIVSSRHTSEIKAKELEFKASSATMEAQLQTAKENLSMLNKQVEDYKAQITADREARVEEAKARGGQSINVVADSKR
jgi:NADH dehydrogenase/NADH:ubiquinone oxidoreductase subunit G